MGSPLRDHCIRFLWRTTALMYHVYVMTYVLKVLSSKCKSDSNDQFPCNLSRQTMVFHNNQWYSKAFKNLHSFFLLFLIKMQVIIMFEKSFPAPPRGRFWMSVRLCATITMPKLYARKCSKDHLLHLSLLAPIHIFCQHSSYISRTLSFKSNLQTKENDGEFRSLKNIKYFRVGWKCHTFAFVNK